MYLVVVKRGVAGQAVTLDREWQIADERIGRLSDVYGCTIECPAPGHVGVDRFAITQVASRDGQVAGCCAVLI